MIREYTVLHLFAGIGGAALGFQNAEADHKGLKGRFRTLAGIDVDAAACADFEALTGAPGYIMDLFSRKDYRAFHSAKPPEGWAEVEPGDLRLATDGVHPDVVFLSPPCKGFSGLLPEKSAKSAKYQALNNLVVRGLRLVLDAYIEDLPGIIIMENVPRITSRGKALLIKVKALLVSHGYLLHEASHDCGELGGLGQKRKRYLLIARRPERLPSFVYRPPKRALLSIGDILGPLPLPDAPEMGPMHRCPRLTWKTLLRLALIPAGGDWRDLKNIGDYDIVPWAGDMQVCTWDAPGKTVTGSSRVGTRAGSYAVGDPRGTHNNVYRVTHWDRPAGCVTGASNVGSGAVSVADPRGRHHNHYRIVPWDRPAGCVTGAHHVAGGAACVADPRVHDFSARAGSLGVVAWDKPASTITGRASVTSSNCPASVADPRYGCQPRGNTKGPLGVLKWGEPGGTVFGALDIHAGAAAVADPRLPADHERPDSPPVIIALDGTWHRPLTTLELAALQGFPLTMPDGTPLKLQGRADDKWRERIGNAVPPPAAEAMAREMLHALLSAELGSNYTLPYGGIWVSEESKTQTTGGDHAKT